MGEMARRVHPYAMQSVRRRSRSFVIRVVTEFYAVYFDRWSEFFLHHRRHAANKSREACVRKRRSGGHTPQARQLNVPRMHLGANTCGHHDTERHRKWG